MANTKKASSEAAEAADVKAKNTDGKAEDVSKAEKKLPARKSSSTGRKTAVKAESSDEALKAAPAKTEKPADTQPKKKAVRKPKAVSLTPFEEIVAVAGKKTAKAKSFKDFAAQITMNGKVEGIFYVKAADGNVDVQPFDYKNADIYVTVDSDALLSLIGGGDVEKAVKDGLLEMDGGSLSTVVALKSVLF